MNTDQEWQSGGFRDFYERVGWVVADDSQNSSRIALKVISCLGLQCFGCRLGVWGLPEKPIGCAFSDLKHQMEFVCRSRPPLDRIGRENYKPVPCLSLLNWFSASRQRLIATEPRQFPRQTLMSELPVQIQDCPMMKSWLRTFSLVLLTCLIGCSATSPRGLSWGFRNKSKSSIAKNSETEGREQSSKLASSKNSRGRSSNVEKNVTGDSKDLKKSEDIAGKLMERARQSDDRNDLVQADKLYRQVLEREPENSVAIRRLANIADLQNRFGEAEEFYHRGLSIRPDDPELLNDLGYSLFLQSRFEESEEVLRKALAIKPDHVYAMNNLGYLLSKRAQQNNDVRDYQLALEIFREANGPEAAQKTVEELFPNGPPQALAQTSNQSNPFTGGQITPPSGRNPFEPDRSNVVPQGTSNQFGTGTIDRNIGATGAPVIHPTISAGASPQSLGQSSPLITPQPQAMPGAALGQPQQPLPPQLPITSSALAQPDFEGGQSSVAPNAYGATQSGSPLMQSPSLQQQWNSTNPSGTGAPSAMWDHAQMEAAQMSLNSMFPVANSAGQSAIPAGSPVLSSPNPSTGWGGNGGSPLDRTLTPPTAGSLGNSQGIPAQVTPVQSGMGWQSQPPTSPASEFPAPNPFEGASSTSLGPRGAISRQGANPASTTGTTATDIELFEAELMQQGAGRGGPVGQAAPRYSPVIQPASAAY